MPNNDVNYSYAGIGLTASLDGTTVEVVQATLRYPLNDVATAVLKLALGDSGRGRRALGYQAVRQARLTRSPLKVTANFTGQERPGKGWSGGRTVLFDGYVGGSGVDAVAARTVGLTIAAEHVLSELDAGSKLSHVVHASSEYDVWKKAVTSYDVFSTTAGMSPVIKVPPLAAITDIWNNLIKPAFQLLAQSGEGLVDFMPGIGRGAVNDRVLNALRTINRGNAMKAAIKRGHKLQEKTADSLVDSLLMKESGQSMLETLLNFCNVWQMAVIPLFSGALVVPHLPTYRRIYRRIGADEIFTVTTQSEWPRTPIRGVLMVSGNSVAFSNSDAQKAMPAGTGVADLGLMGGGTAYGNYAGQMLILGVPAAFGEFHMPAAVSSKLPVEKKNSAFIGNPRLRMPTPARHELEGLEDGGFVSDLAKAHLCRYRYQGRSVTIVGRVRTDICPGSIVEVEMLGDVGEMVSMFGCVTEVSYFFSAEQPYAATAITVSYLRTELEQSGSPAIMSEHPLFTTTFVGGAMTA